MKRSPLFIVLFTIVCIISAVVLTNLSFTGPDSEARGQVRMAPEQVEMVSLKNYGEVQPAIDGQLSFNKYVDATYKNCKLKATGLDKKVFAKAMAGYYNLAAEGKLTNEKSVISVVDFSKRSTEKRLWVIDLKTNKILYHTLIAHGRNTGEQYAKCFSNECNSNMSSLGFYVTAETYTGKHGLSLVIDGVEEGFNDNARERSVVIHGADYVSKQFASQVGRIGRSLGCPAVPMELAPEIISTIADQTCLFIYYPDSKYEKNTKYYNAATAADYFTSSRQMAQK